MKITRAIVAICSLSAMSAVKSEEILCKARPGCQLARCDPISSLRLKTNEYPLICVKSSLPGNAAKSEYEQLKRQFQSLKTGMSGYNTKLINFKNMKTKLMSEF